MKIFCVYAKVELTDKPEWLDAFRAKYDQPYEYHITLKQPCNIAEDKIDEAKQILQEFLQDNKFGTIRLTLDNLFIDRSPSGMCIMFKSENDRIKKLQHGIIQSLKTFSDYFIPEYEQFESNFIPHITIAREMDEETLEKALSELPNDYKCEGEISELVLVSVSKKTAEQVNEPDNQTIYKLN